MARARARARARVRARVKHPQHDVVLLLGHRVALLEHLAQLPLEAVRWRLVGPLAQLQ